MADGNKDKFNIRLHVYDEEINVTINRDEEELYRAAAKMITDRYNVYAKLFKGRKGDHTIALMTLIDVALQYQREHTPTLTQTSPVSMFAASCSQSTFC